MCIKWQDDKWIQASKNLEQYIEDCEVNLKVIQCSFEPVDNKDDENYYEFILQCIEYPTYEVKVTMPSFPLEMLRFTGEKGQNIYDYYRILIDDSSWIWNCALITKRTVIDSIEDRIEQLKYHTDRLNNVLKQINKI
jgi:hypothetical protein